ncbi:hypothetical protein TNCT_608881 [Trichonephila clavata]|uniref:Uncharacterized protein n=1 Tax=Trichonephila clavata TaxID=2740835 RepID=A0A8X6H894_TRICU|nr:hypothetical protein TNCT_608881 [Trichonephila clavata]
MGLIALINIFSLQNSFNLFSSLNPLSAIAKTSPVIISTDFIGSSTGRSKSFGDAAPRKGWDRQDGTIECLIEVRVEKLVLDYCARG